MQYNGKKVQCSLIGGECSEILREETAVQSYKKRLHCSLIGGTAVFREEIAI